MGADNLTITIAELKHIIIPSDVAYAGMPILSAVRSCLRHNLPGIPFCDDSGRIIGRVSLKNLLVENCIPDDVRRHIDLLPDHAHQDLWDVRNNIKDLMGKPVDDYIIPAIPSVGPGAPVFKALAIIDKYNSSYIFVEQDNQYLGTITLIHIVETMMALYRGKDA